MPPEMTFDYFGVRLNGEKAAGKKIALNIDFTDLNKSYALVVENGVLNHFKKPVANADAKLTLSKSTLDRIQLRELPVEQAVTSGELKIDGRREALTEFVGLLDNFPFWFPIVTPKQASTVGQARRADGHSVAARDGRDRLSRAVSLTRDGSER